MAIVELDIIVDEERVELALSSVINSLGDAELMVWLGSDVVRIMQERAQARFRTEGDDASGQWAELSEYTQEDRVRHRYPGAHPINKRTGELERAIVTAQGALEPFGGGTQLDFPGVVDTGTDLSFKIGMSQNGNRFGAPARPVVALGATDLELVLVSLAVHVEQALMRGM